TICYSNDTVQMEDENLNIVESFMNQNKNSLDSFKKQNNNRFDYRNTEAYLDGFTGENMDHLTGIEDYTNYGGVDYTGFNYSIEDLQKENRTTMFYNILLKLGLPLLALFAIYYLMKETILKKKENINEEDESS